MNLCVIPARGGSKRIPRKNIKDFCGKPIIAYSIETAIASGLFNDVIVSTDDEEIALLASEWGASIPFFRAKELSDDFTSTTAVISNAIDAMEKLGKSYDTICCVYATAPLLSIENLKLGYKKLQKNLFAFSVCAFKEPFFRAFKLDENDGVEMFWPDNFNKRSQDLPKAYFDAAQFYFGKPEAFKQNLPIFTNYSVGVEIPSHLVCDIDMPDDWLRAEAMYEALNCK